MVYKNIILGEGLDDITFGMNREALKELLGDPSEIEKTKYEGSDDVSTEVWHYDTLEISASFDEVEDWTLSTLSTTSKEATLNGVRLMGLIRTEFLKRIELLDLGGLSIEDWTEKQGPKVELISFDDYEISFWLENDKVNEIQWGVLFFEEEDDEDVEEDY